MLRQGGLVDFDDYLRFENEFVFLSKSPWSDDSVPMYTENAVILSFFINAGRCLSLDCNVNYL